jgi:mutator protein MutT
MVTRVAIAVVERNGFFLIGQRPEGVPLAGLWEFPGGKINAGETAEAAAVRECLEETGIRVEAILHLSSVRHEYEHGMVELEFIACRVSSSDSSQSKWPFLWVERGALEPNDFPAANRELIGQLLTANSERLSAMNAGPFERISSSSPSPHDSQ